MNRKERATSNSNKNIFNTKILSIFILIFSFVFIICARLNAETFIAGGPCSYNDYKGSAKITSVTTDQTCPDKGIPCFKVKFIFSPEKKVAEKFAKKPGKEYILTINDKYPTEADIKKYNIRKGSSFKGSMSVITKGTCTPVIFDFPSILKK